MLVADLVQEMGRPERAARASNGLRLSSGLIARQLSAGSKLGASRPREPQRRARQLDRFAEFIERRAPEVGFNGVVLYRELQALGFPGA
jgi:hypothetical protein